LITDIAKVILANKIRPKLTLHNLQLVNKISGVILLVFAVSLAWGAFNLSLKH
jgi:putative Ca2+/H+ antiporter (TMEM165/GDT1 family)